MKIFDCFMYFDEDLLLNLRLNILYDYVDKFIILEAKEDHQGNKRDLKFKINNFSKFSEKIKYIPLEKIEIDPKIKIKKNWHEGHLRDQSMRNSIAKYLNDANPDDWIIISDLDEIPNPIKLNKFKSKYKYAFFEQKFFYYKFNIINSSNQNWYGSRICVKKYLKSPQWLRDIKTKKRPFWKFYKAREPQLIMDGGWHFSFLKNSIDISKKIKSYAHQEYHLEKYTDIKKIEEKLNQKSDLFDRDYKYEKIDLNQDFPEYILKNKKKFDKWII